MNTNSCLINNCKSILSFHVDLFEPGDFSETCAYLLTKQGWDKLLKYSEENLIPLDEANTVISIKLEGHIENIESKICGIKALMRPEDLCCVYNENLVIIILSESQTPVSSALIKRMNSFFTKTQINVKIAVGYITTEESIEDVTRRLSSVVSSL